MRRSNRTIVLGLAMASALAASAAGPAPDPAPAPGVGLDWLAGHWCGGEDGDQVEESWTGFLANESIGMSRTVRGGRILSFEFMRILELDGVLTFIAQPNGEPATSFTRADGGEGWIRFENKEHDFPQRIEYRKAGDGLLAEIGGPGAEGKEEVISYRYARCPAGSP
jgi:hypothetical protein